MGGIFGVISTKQCRNDLFYGVDYHSHLGTRRGGMAVYNGDGIFARDIHSLENSYFRVKFEDDLYKYTGNLGIGVISDTDAQPIVVNSHLGRFAIVTVGKICNIADLEKEMLSQNKNFTELSSGKTNPTELIAQIITCSPSFEEGIKSVQQKIKGSCTFVILTENCLIACRDLYGRTPLIIGKKDTEEDGQRVQAHAVASESCSFPNLGYKDEYILGPGEAVRMTADSLEQIVKPGKKMLPVDLLRLSRFLLRGHQRGRGALQPGVQNGQAGRLRHGHRMFHPRFRHLYGHRLFRWERRTIPQRIREVHSDMATQFHSDQSGQTQPGC